MRQIDVTNAVGAINEAQDFEVPASPHKRLPGQAYSREGDYSIEHSDSRMPALLPQV